LIDVLTYLGNVLIIAQWFYINDKARVVGCANNPPIRQSRIAEGGEKKSGKY
jgi:hypothetical protein